jgi:hypothetical protein
MAGERRVVDREKVLVVLRKRFPSARVEDIAAAANAIVGLAPEYVPLDGAELGRLECVAGSQAYTAADVVSGRLRMYRRVT